MAVHLGHGLSRQRGAEVAFTGGTGHGDDHLALVLGPLRDLNGRPDVGTRSVRRSIDIVSGLVRMMW